jgi:2-hydroxychromene-2-carboxylate isomerase
MADVTFFFDPACPWTWRASRWLTTVADARGLDVEWRPFSLLVLNDGKPADEHRVAVEAAHRALRLIEQLARAGRQDDISRFYTTVGELAHEGGAPVDDDLIAHAVHRAGLDDEAAALDDRGLDAGVEESTSTAIASAGPDVGSPVMILAGAERGLHGPVLKSVPEKAGSLALWTAVEALAPIDEFFEIKRGRR